MKKTILSILVLGGLLSFGEAKAQSFGLRGGINFQNLTGKDNNGNDFSNKLTTRFHGGVNVSIPVATDFVVRPEVLYVGKGAKSPAGNDYRINYIEVPVNLIYKPKLGNGNLMLGFGPYVGFGVGGKVEFTNGTEHDVKFEENVTNPQAGVAYYRKTDAGANVLGGYDFGRFSVQLNAQLGLANMYPEFNGVEPNAKIKNTGFGLSLGLDL